jgi:hypothetical protein
VDDILALVDRKDMLSSSTASKEPSPSKSRLEKSTSKSSLEDKSYVVGMITTSPEPSLQMDTIMTPYDQTVQSNGKSVEVEINSGSDHKVSDPNTDVLTTPRQHNLTVSKETNHSVNKVEDTDGSIMTDEAEENDMTEDITWVNIEGTQGFQQVHYRLFDTINTWMLQDNIKKHPFY